MCVYLSVYECLCLCFCVCMFGVYSLCVCRVYRYLYAYAYAYGRTHTQTKIYIHIHTKNTHKRTQNLHKRTHIHKQKTLIHIHTQNTRKRPPSLSASLLPLCLSLHISLPLSHTHYLGATRNYEVWNDRRGEVEVDEEADAMQALEARTQVCDIHI